MHAVILTVHLLIALALILVVLLQRSEGGGLGMGGGSGVMTSRGAATALSKLTWALGTAFVVTSLVLTVLAARDAGVGSVVDTLGVGTPVTETTQPEAPAPAGLEGDLLPTLPAETPADATPAAPAAGDAPAAPPPVQ